MAKSIEEDRLKANASLQRSHNMIDQYIGQSMSVMASLGNQREALKSAQRVLIDIGSKIGISKSLLTAVTRRQSGDRLIVLGGMVITLIVVILCIRWLWS